MLIRPFLPHDQPRLFALTVEAFEPFYEGSLRPLLGDAIFEIQQGRWREDHWHQLAGLHDPARHRFVAVAEVDGVVDGYVAWNVEPERRRGRVEILAVDAEHRRDRLGTALCEHAFAEMREHGAEAAEVATVGDDFHAPARALYESLGCVPLPATLYYRQL